MCLVLVGRHLVRGRHVVDGRVVVVWHVGRACPREGLPMVHYQNGADVWSRVVQARIGRRKDEDRVESRRGVLGGVEQSAWAGGQ